MNELKIRTSPEFETKLASYPDFVRDKMYGLRKLINDTAKEITEITELEETLKWGEPSFLSKHGSTLRMDWKKKTPDQYQLYFKCTSRLVETFKIVFGNKFEYEKSRAIIFRLNEDIPTKEIKKCIKATLMYHKVKDDIKLGMQTQFFFKFIKGANALRSKKTVLCGSIQNH
jgi:hypothetical protein